MRNEDTEIAPLLTYSMKTFWRELPFAKKILTELLQNYSKEEFQNINSAAWQVFRTILQEKWEGIPIQNNKRLKIPLPEEAINELTTKAFLEICCSHPYEHLTWEQEQLGYEFTVNGVFYYLIEKLIPNIKERFFYQAYIYYINWQNLAGYSDPICGPNTGETAIKEAFDAAGITLLTPHPSQDHVDECMAKLLFLYQKFIFNWCKEHGLVDTQEEVPKWIIDFLNKKIQATSNITYISALRVLNEPIDTTEDFLFPSQKGWHPNKRPYVSRKRFEERIRNAFEQYLQEYCSQKEKLQKELAVNREVQNRNIEWFIRNRILNQSITEIGEIYEPITKPVRKGLLDPNFKSLNGKYTRNLKARHEKVRDALKKAALELGFKD